VYLRIQTTYSQSNMRPRDAREEQGSFAEPRFISPGGGNTYIKEMQRMFSPSKNVSSRPVVE